MTLDQRWTGLRGHPAGFDYMRIALAVAVLVWHSYAYSYGIEAAYKAFYVEGFGYLMVLVLPMFFTLSGFLVAGSMDRTPSLKAFLGLRAIRIFPGLVVEIILSALILGPFVTTYSLRAYFSSPVFGSYFANCVGWVHYVLPGVFTNNPLPDLVNGSLWTVPFELECYILISILALAGMFKNKRLVLPLFVLATIVIAIDLKVEGQHTINSSAVNGRLLVLSFFSGIVFSRLRGSIPWNVPAGVAALVMASALFMAGHGLPYFAPLLAGYGTVCLGLTDPRRTIVVTSGDYSYGVYLYAAPIQQTVAHVLGGRSTWAINVAIALPAAVAFALFSWWCVEKPFLRLRRLLKNKPAQTPARAGDEPAAVPVGAA